MVKKQKNIEFNINSNTSEYGSINTNFYTEDVNSSTIRMRIKYEDEYLNLTEVDMTPRLDLFHSDGSIWLDESITVPIPEIGLVQYNIPENVIQHSGEVKAKLFLENAEKSIHVSNFNFKILDSGVEGAVEKEITLTLVKDTLIEIMQENSLGIIDETFRVELFDDIKDYLLTNNTSFKGTDGLQGAKGDKGDKGDTGERGATGVQGVQGAQGPKGETGAVGPKGDKGDQGTPGLDGVDGTMTFEELTPEQKLELKGDTGDQGIQGPKGDRGDQGIQGIQGEQGPQGEIPNTSTWQKYKLTPDNGQLGVASLSSDLTILRALAPGFYYKTGVPITGASSTAGFITVEMKDAGLKRITFRPYNSTQEYVMRYYNTWGNWERTDVQKDAFMGAMLKLNTNINTVSGTTYFVAWQSAVYNTSGFWSPTNPSRITIPAGVKRVRLSANVLWESNSTGNRLFRMQKNGTYSAGLPYWVTVGVTTSATGGSSGIVEVTAGDYFELEVRQTSTPAVNLDLRADPYTWLQIEVIELEPGVQNPFFSLIAHRGASGYEDEHTIEAYELGLSQGANYIELDLRLTSDNKLICMHDATLDRTTTGTGSVSSKTLSQIKALRTTNGKVIPTLEEVVAHFGKDVNYYIETKAPFDLAMDQETLRILKNAGLIGIGSKRKQVIIQSFADDSLKNIKNQYSDIFLVKLTTLLDNTIIDNAKALGVDGIGPKYINTTKALVTYAKNKGLVTHPWTANTRAEMDNAISMGVDGFFTNTPDIYFT